MTDTAMVHADATDSPARAAVLAVCLSVWFAPLLRPRVLGHGEVGRRAGQLRLDAQVRRLVALVVRAAPLTQAVMRADTAGRRSRGLGPTADRREGGREDVRQRRRLTYLQVGEQLEGELPVGLGVVDGLARLGRKGLGRVGLGVVQRPRLTA